MHGAVTHLRTAVGLCSVLVVAGFAAAQDQASPLSGPDVPDQATETLVHTDMQGRFQRLEGRPEVEALHRLPLDPEVRLAAQRVIETRASALREHLIEQIDLIKESTDAIRSGDRPRAQQLSQELFDLWEPAHVRAPLLEPLSEVLPPPHTEKLAELIDGYWEAWLDAEQRAREQPNRHALEQRLRFEVYQTELTQAYNAALNPFRQKLERIYEITDASPDQRSEIRDAVIQYIKDSRGRPDADLREALARSIDRILTEDQRIRLLGAALSVL